MMKFELPYGLRGNEILTIDEVPSGLACDCICPSCKNKLIARKGRVKAHHFAHYKSEDCMGGLETALHKLSKAIIADSKTFITPILYYPRTHYEIYEEREIQIDSVTLEARVGEIIPDIIIESKGKKLLVEIVVSNPVSWDKEQRIKSENLATIVIYVRYILENLFMRKDFRLQDHLYHSELVSGTRYKRWLCNPKIETIQQKLKDNYAELKRVQSFKGELGYYNYVAECPLEKRTWNSGRNEGKSYASIERDCQSCPYCNSITYKNISNTKLLSYECPIPHSVYCLGYLKDDFKELIKLIR